MQRRSVVGYSRLFSMIYPSQSILSPEWHICLRLLTRKGCQLQNRKPGVGRVTAMIRGYPDTRHGLTVVPAARLGGTRKTQLVIVCTSETILFQGNYMRRYRPQRVDAGCPRRTFHPDNHDPTWAGPHYCTSQESSGNCCRGAITSHFRKHQWSICGRRYSRMSLNRVTKTIAGIFLRSKRRHGLGLVTSFPDFQRIRFDIQLVSRELCYTLKSLRMLCSPSNSFEERLCELYGLLVWRAMN